MHEVLTTGRFMFYSPCEPPCSLQEGTENIINHRNISSMLLARLPGTLRDSKTTLTETRKYAPLENVGMFVSFD